MHTVSVFRGCLQFDVHIDYRYDKPNQRCQDLSEFYQFYIRPNLQYTSDGALLGSVGEWRSDVKKKAVSTVQEPVL